MLGPFPEPTTGVSLANKVSREVFEDSNRYEVTIVNTSYNRFDENIGKFSFHKLFFYLGFYLRFYKVFQNNIIYITPGQSFFGVAKYALFIMLANLFRKEIVMHIHGNHLGTEYTSLSGFRKKLFRYLLSKTTKGIVLSKSLDGNMLPFISEEKIHVLYNFAEDYLTTNFTLSDAKQLQIIYLSNLMEEKGIFHLLEALMMMEKEGIPYNAKIAGAIDNDNKARVESLFAQLEHTEYLGIVKCEEKKKLLHWGNCFVLPTFYKMEGQPISILEAMATGNIIITTQHAGIPDVVKEDINGYFVDPKSTLDLFKVMASMSAKLNDIDRISSENRKEFSQKYSLKQFGSRLLKIIDE